MGHTKRQWRFHTCWIAAGIDGTPRDYAETYDFADQITAVRAHNAARRGQWMQSGWARGWLSELREYEVDMESAGHRARIVAVVHPAADVPNPADESEAV